MKSNIAFLIFTLMMTSCHDNSELNINKPVETKLKETTFDYSKFDDTMDTTPEVLSNISNSKENAPVHKLNEIDKKEIKKQKLIEDKIYKEYDALHEFREPLFALYNRRKDKESEIKPKLFNDIFWESLILSGLGNESNCIKLEEGKVYFF